MNESVRPTVADVLRAVTSGEPDLRIWVHLPIDGDDSAERLRNVRHYVA